MLKTIEHGEVRELQLDFPPVNALRAELLAGLARAVREAPREGACAVVISRTPRFFSAGLDVPHLLEAPGERGPATFEALFDLLRAITHSEVPVAAAVTGHSPAGGAVIAIFCDYRVMAAGDFRIGLNEVQVGLPLPPVIQTAMRRLVGPRRAERMCEEAMLIAPEQALHAGLVDAVVDAGEVVTDAVDWCRRLLALPPEALRTTRRVARSDLVAAVDATGGSVPAEFMQAWAGAETQAAMRALVERLGRK